MFVQYIYVSSRCDENWYSPELVVDQSACPTEALFFLAHLYCHIFWIFANGPDGSLDLLKRRTSIAIQYLLDL